ncbi:MAG: hypothetical protein ACO1NX_10510 [Chitinophagaceae bacterium]
MKPLLSAFLVLIIACFTGCDKNKVDERSINTLSIVGSWELRAIEGGMLPRQEMAPGNGNVLEFTPTHYTRYTNHTAVKTGTYTIIEDSTASKQ